MNIETQVKALAKKVNMTPAEFMAAITHMVDVQEKGYQWFPKKREAVETPKQAEPTQEIPAEVLKDMEALGVSDIKDYPAASAKREAEKEAKKQARIKRQQEEERINAELDRKIEAGEYKAEIAPSLFGSDEVEEESVIAPAMTDEEIAALREANAKELAEQQAKIQQALDNPNVVLMSDEQYEAYLEQKKAAKALDTAKEEFGEDYLGSMRTICTMESGSPKKRKVTQWIEVFGSDIQKVQVTLVMLKEEYGIQTGTIKRLEGYYTETYQDHAEYRVIEKPVQERTETQQYYANKNFMEKDAKANAAMMDMDALVQAERPVAIQGDDSIIDLTKPLGMDFFTTPVVEQVAEDTPPWEEAAEETVTEPTVDGLDLTTQLFAGEPIKANTTSFIPPVKEVVEETREDKEAKLAQLKALDKPSQWNIDQIRQLESELASEPTPVIELMEEVVFNW